MNINIKATNTDLDDGISTYVHQKMGDVEKFIKSNDPDSISLYFEIEKTTGNQQTGPICRAEANLNVGGKYFRAESSQDTLYAAVDEVKDEIISAIKSHQDKEHTLWKKGRAKLKNIIKGISRDK